jgi:hypothetical protein
LRKLAKVMTSLVSAASNLCSPAVDIPKRRANAAPDMPKASRMARTQPSGGLEAKGAAFHDASEASVCCS